jgi:hypothetical protein
MLFCEGAYEHLIAQAPVGAALNCPAELRGHGREGLPLSASFPLFRLPLSPFPC